MSPDQLHTWISANLNLHIPRTAVCPGHSAPFDYIQHAFFEHPGDLIVWAPRGGGKTTLGAVATLLDLLFKPRCQTRILGGSLEQSLRMWEHLIPMLESTAQDLLAEPPRSRKVRMESGASAAVLTQSERCVRGQRVQKLRCDEVEMFDPAIWQAAQLTTRSLPPAPDLTDAGFPLGIPARIEALSTLHEPFGLMQQLIDQAPQRGTRVIRWCLIDVLQRCDPARSCPHCPLLEDCQGRAKTQCEGYIAIDDAIAMKSRVSRDTWAAEMLCQRPSRQSVVYPMFDRQRHVTDQMFWPNLAGLDTHLAIDFGYSSLSVILWLLRDRAGRVFVLDELATSHQTLYQIIDAIRAKPYPGFRKVCCDPAGRQHNRQSHFTDVNVLQHAGFAVRNRPSKIESGLDLIRTALDPAVGEPTLRIHPRCATLIRSLEQYHYNPDTGTPEKDNLNDHATDALRYYYIATHHTPARVGSY